MRGIVTVGGSPFAALVTAGNQLAALVRDGFRTLAHPRRAGWRLAIALLWVAGIAGDAFTTVAMMGSGEFEEANGLAAAGMNVLGTGGYTTLASVWAGLFAITCLGRPRGLYAVTAWTALTLLGAAKCYVALHNAWLWAQ